MKTAHPFSLFALLFSLSLPSINTSLSHPGVGIVMDSKGNLFYTDLKHVWKITPNGTRSIAVRNVHTHELFVDEKDNFVRDRSGAMYWADRGEPTVIRQRSPDGVVHTIATANFTNVRWMTVAPDGTLYLVDLHDLVQKTPGGSGPTP